MRGLRSFLVLLVIAAGLGGYAYFVESKREPADTKKNEKVFAGVEADKIERVTVKSEKGETTTVEKKSGKWEETQPAAVDADQGELSGLTSNLASVESQRVVDEQATDFKQYGLDPPKDSAIAELNDGSRYELQIGDKTPVQTGTYAKLSDSADCGSTFRDRHCRKPPLMNFITPI